MTKEGLKSRKTDSHLLFIGRLRAGRQPDFGETPFAALTPAPPTIYFVLLSQNSYLAGPIPLPVSGGGHALRSPLTAVLYALPIRQNKIAISLIIIEIAIAFVIDYYYLPVANLKKNNLYQAMTTVVFKSYNPRMLLKVIVYAYLNNVYSGRQIEKLLIENIAYICG